MLSYLIVGVFRGFAHLDFPNSSETVRASNVLSGTTLHGRKLRVGLAKSSRLNGGSGEFVIFVGNVSTKITSSLFEGFLSRIVGRDAYKRFTLGLNKRSGNADYYVHIHCWNEEGRIKVMEKLAGLKLLDRIIRVERGRSAMVV